MDTLFALPAFRDPLDPATVYVFHSNPLREPLPSHEWLRLYDPELPAFKVRFRAEGVPARSFVTAFGLDGLPRDEDRSRAAVDWRLNWYRDPAAAWWEQ